MPANNNNISLIESNDSGKPWQHLIDQIISCSGEKPDYSAPLHIGICPFSRTRFEEIVFKGLNIDEPFQVMILI